MCHMDQKKKSPLELKNLYLGITFLFFQELVSLTFMRSELRRGDDLQREGLILPHHVKAVSGRDPPRSEAALRPDRNLPRHPALSLGLSLGLCLLVRGEAISFWN